MTVVAEPRNYRGVARDDRVRARRAALLDAALDALHADGLSGVSVRSICAGAQLTPRYFYESFADLDDLLVGVVDAVAEEVAQAALLAMTGAGACLGDQVRAGIAAGYAVVADDRRKATALLVAAAGHGPLRERRTAITVRYADLALATLPPLRARTAAERRAARAAALFLMGGTGELIVAVLSGRLRLSRAAVVEQLTALWLAALSPRSPLPAPERHTPS
ncbi:MAG: TetR family transcriptional regulator [Jatrophihabitans sp.]|nr:MAG: TetR family transcriptional regulator [Jatrophihabitans sp.]